MKKACSNVHCSETFEWSEEDNRLFAKFDIDLEPTMCPVCRHRQRAVFKSSIVFHKRCSDLSGKSLISIFPEDAAFPVYSMQEWWGDSWDALSFGRQRDSSKTLFEQIADLSFEVPRQSCFSTKTENSEFNAACSDAKNIYYSMTVHRSEDVYYSEHITAYNNMICDGLRCFRSQYLYECINCSNCYQCTWCINCTNSRDCNFCIDCAGCSNCLFCSNLRHKQYYVFNKAVSKSEYERILQQTIDGSYATLQHNLNNFAQVKSNALYKHLNNTQAENCVGDGLLNCSSSYLCFNCRNAVGCRYCISLTPSERSVNFMDVSSAGIGELVYNCSSVGGGNYYLRMCSNCRESSSLTYCIDCFSCKDCLASIGLRNKQYCILNKQYSKNEYERISREIILQMKQQGVFGKFFPQSMSPFAYNNSFAQEIYPLTKEQAQNLGFKWDSSREINDKAQIEQSNMPDSILEVDENCLKTEIICKESGRIFRITAQELRFYKLLNLPLPRLHPDLRIRKRREAVNSYRLWQRSCSICSNTIQSSFSPEDKRQVCCEGCYMANVVS